MLLWHKFNSTVAKPFLRFLGCVRWGVVVMKNWQIFPSLEHLRNVMLEQWTQQIVNIIIGIDFGLWFDKAKLGFAPLTDAGEEHDTD